MAKLLVEDKEIKISEKSDVETGEHIIENNNYILRSITRTEFKSSIYTYEEEKVLISKIIRFNEEYYKIVLFNDKAASAWTLIEISSKLNIAVKRLLHDAFFIIGDSSSEGITSQVSFCKMKPSGRVEEITINFNKLKDIHFLAGNSILLYYNDKDGDVMSHTLALYDYRGKLQKTLYEYRDSDAERFSYEIENGKIRILKIE